MNTGELSARPTTPSGLKDGGGLPPEYSLAGKFCVICNRTVRNPASLTCSPTCAKGRRKRKQERKPDWWRQGIPCPICGKPNRQRQKTCSPKCGSLWRERTKSPE